MADGSNLGGGHINTDDLAKELSGSLKDMFKTSISKAKKDASKAAKDQIDREFSSFGEELTSIITNAIKNSGGSKVEISIDDLVTIDFKKVGYTQKNSIEAIKKKIVGQTNELLGGLQDAVRNAIPQAGAMGKPLSASDMKEIAKSITVDSAQIEDAVKKHMSANPKALKKDVEKYYKELFQLNAYIDQQEKLLGLNRNEQNNKYTNLGNLGKKVAPDLKEIENYTRNLYTLQRAQAAMKSITRNAQGDIGITPIMNMFYEQAESLAENLLGGKNSKNSALSKMMLNMSNSLMGDMYKWADKKQNTSQRTQSFDRLAEKYSKMTNGYGGVAVPQGYAKYFKDAEEQAQKYIDSLENVEKKLQIIRDKFQNLGLDQKLKVSDQTDFFGLIGARQAFGFDPDEIDKKIIEAYGTNKNTGRLKPEKLLELQEASRQAVADAIANNNDLIRSNDALAESEEKKARAVESSTNAQGNANRRRRNDNAQAGQGTSAINAEADSLNNLAQTQEHVAQTAEESAEREAKAAEKSAEAVKQAEEKKQEAIKESSKVQDSVEQKKAKKRNTKTTEELLNGISEKELTVLKQTLGSFYAGTDYTESLDMLANGFGINKTRKTQLNRIIKSLISNPVTKANDPLGMRNIFENYLVGNWRDPDTLLFSIFANNKSNQSQISGKQYKLDHFLNTSSNFGDYRTFLKKASEKYPNLVWYDEYNEDDDLYLNPDKQQIEAIIQSEQRKQEAIKETTEAIKEQAIINQGQNDSQPSVSATQVVESEEKKQNAIQGTNETLTKQSEAQENATKVVEENVERQNNAVDSQISKLDELKKKSEITFNKKKTPEGIYTSDIEGIYAKKEGRSYSVFDNNNVKILQGLRTLADVEQQTRAYYQNAYNNVSRSTQQQVDNLHQVAQAEGERADASRQAADAVVESQERQRNAVSETTNAVNNQTEVQENSNRNFGREAQLELEQQHSKAIQDNIRKNIELQNEQERQAEEILNRQIRNDNSSAESTELAEIRKQDAIKRTRKVWEDSIKQIERKPHWEVDSDLPNVISGVEPPRGGDGRQRRQNGPRDWRSASYSDSGSWQETYRVALGRTVTNTYNAAKDEFDSKQVTNYNEVEKAASDLIKKYLNLKSQFNLELYENGITDYASDIAHQIETVGKHLDEVSALAGQYGQEKNPGFNLNVFWNNITQGLEIFTAELETKTNQSKRKIDDSRKKISKELDTYRNDIQGKLDAINSIYKNDESYKNVQNALNAINPKDVYNKESLDKVKANIDNLFSVLQKNISKQQENLQVSNTFNREKNAQFKIDAGESNIQGIQNAYRKLGLEEDEVLKKTEAVTTALNNVKAASPGLQDGMNQLGEVFDISDYTSKYKIFYGALKEARAELTSHSEAYRQLAKFEREAEKAAKDLANAERTIGLGKDTDGLAQLAADRASRILNSNLLSRRQWIENNPSIDKNVADIWFSDFSRLQNGLNTRNSEAITRDTNKRLQDADNAMKAVMSIRKAYEDLGATQDEIHNKTDSLINAIKDFQNTQRTDSEYFNKYDKFVNLLEQARNGLANNSTAYRDIANAEREAFTALKKYYDLSEKIKLGKDTKGTERLDRIQAIRDYNSATERRNAIARENGIDSSYLDPWSSYIRDWRVKRRAGINNLADKQAAEAAKQADKQSKLDQERAAREERDTARRVQASKDAQNAVDAIANAYRKLGRSEEEIAEKTKAVNNAINEFNESSRTNPEYLKKYDAIGVALKHAREELAKNSQVFKEMEKANDDAFNALKRYYDLNEKIKLGKDTKGTEAIERDHSIKEYERLIKSRNAIANANGIDPTSYFASQDEYVERWRSKRRLGIASAIVAQNKEEQERANKQKKLDDQRAANEQKREAELTETRNKSADDAEKAIFKIESEYIKLGETQEQAKKHTDELSEALIRFWDMKPTDNGYLDAYKNMIDALQKARDALGNNKSAYQDIGQVERNALAALEKYQRNNNKVVLGKMTTGKESVEAEQALSLFDSLIAKRNELIKQYNIPVELTKPWDDYIAKLKEANAAWLALKQGQVNDAATNEANKQYINEYDKLNAKIQEAKVALENLKAVQANASGTGLLDDVAKAAENANNKIREAENALAQIESLSKSNPGAVTEEMFISSFVALDDIMKEFKPNINAIPGILGFDEQSLSAARDLIFKNLKTFLSTDLFKDTDSLFAQRRDALQKSIDNLYKIKPNIDTAVGKELSDKLFQSIWNDINERSKSAFEQSDNSLSRFIDRAKKKFDSLGLLSKEAAESLDALKNRFTDLDISNVSNTGWFDFFDNLRKEASGVGEEIDKIRAKSAQAFLNNEHANDYKNLEAMLNGPGINYSALQKAKTEVDELRSKLEQGEISTTKYAKSYDQVVNKFRNVISATTGSAEQNRTIMENWVRAQANGADVILKWGKNNEKLTGTFKNQNDEIVKVVANCNMLQGTISGVVAEQKKAQGALSLFFSSLSGKWVEVLRYLATFGSIYRVFGELRKGIGVIQEYDKALTEMNKVSNDSFNSLKNFQRESFALADAVGVTASTIQNSAADWMRLGRGYIPCRII